MLYIVKYYYTMLKLLKKDIKTVKNHKKDI